MSRFYKQTKNKLELVHINNKPSSETECEIATCTMISFRNDISNAISYITLPWTDGCNSGNRKYYKNDNRRNDVTDYVNIWPVFGSGGGFLVSGSTSVFFDALTNL